MYFHELAYIKNNDKLINYFHKLVSIVLRQVNQIQQKFGVVPGLFFKNCSGDEDELTSHSKYYSLSL